MKHTAKKVLILMLAAIIMLQCAMAGDTVNEIKLNQVQQRKENLTMYVGMSDSVGEPYTGRYRADQFSISVDGKALDVDSVEKFDPMVQGIHYVFSVDISRSLTPEMMESIHAGMHAFVSLLGPLDTVSLITFGDGVTVLLSNCSDHDTIHATIDTIQAVDGMTALYAGVIAAVDVAETTGGRSAIVIITDGKDSPLDDMKIYTKDSIYESVKKAQVPLYCIGLNGKEGVDTGSLIEFANITGGDQFVLQTNDITASLERVNSIMQNALVLRATLVNTENKAGFDEISVFKVGYQPDDGAFVTSNELEQNINWKNVPVPTVAPSPTPVPRISLSMDNVDVQYVPGEKVTITGAIEIEAGYVDPDTLSIYVDDEPWEITELMQNGASYNFTAEGQITGGTDQMKVQAEISTLGIASRIQWIDVTLPAPEPTETPAPVLTVELDDSGREIQYEPGSSVMISGVVNVQGEIEQGDLKLFVNDEDCEMTVLQINRSQYEFEAEYTPQGQMSDELDIRVQLNGTDIYSRVQKLFLAMPTPTPNPELSFSLWDATVVYVDGEELTIRGNIEVLSGEVEPDDLALYVNNVKWDMTLESLSDGTYGFTATNVLADSDITQLDVKIRLKSNTKVVSNAEKLAVVVPTPAPTPVPTPRPVVTPPPAMVKATQTPEPVVQTPAPTMPAEGNASFVDKCRDMVQQLVDSGKIWYVVAGIILLVLLIVLLVIIIAKNAKKKIIQPVNTSTNFSLNSRDGDTNQSVTRRENDGPATERNDMGYSDFADTSAVGQSGTVHIDAAGDGTMRIESESGGTMRLDDVSEDGGTQRIEEEIPSISIRMEEKRGREEFDARQLNMEKDDELVFGRNDSANVVIADTTVSGRHMMLTYDGTILYLTDMGSTNGTKLNGETVSRGEQKILHSNDTVVIGKTTITFSFDESEEN